jgi:hypothetical protein
MESGQQLRTYKAQLVQQVQVAAMARTEVMARMVLMERP